MTSVTLQSNPAIRICVAQLGAREDYSIPIALHNQGYLHKFYTDVYLQPYEANFLHCIGQFQLFNSLSSKFLSRYNPYLKSSKVKRFNALGISYLNAIRRATSYEVMYQVFIDYGHKFNRAILKSGFPNGGTAIYAFDHAALDLFESGMKSGMKCILNQIYPAFYEEILEQEEETYWPDWSKAPRSSYYRSSTYQQWCDIQLAEWEMADTIIVNSQYSQKAILSLAPQFTSKLQIVPLTVNLEAYKPYKRIRQYDRKRPLKVLFVGSVNLRKGIPYLLAAFQAINPSIAELKVAGTIQIHSEKFSELGSHIEFTGAIPYIKMPQIYYEADILILPTVSDGFGAVMLEAMATGLPVITTYNSGDIVVDGYNGFSIPIRSSETIVKTIYRIYEQPEILTQLSQGAIDTCQHYTIEQYQSRLCTALNLPIAC